MTTAKPKRGPSVIKTLTELIQSNPSNRSCADCRSALVDPSHVYASFCPSSSQNTNDASHNPEVSVAFHDFQLTHRAFAPPDIQQNPSKFGTDPALLVNQRFGGHGVFICAKCAEAHKGMGTPITKVHPVQDATAWTQEQAQFMKMSGGNSRNWTVYERYMSDIWKNRRPSPSSSLSKRIIFCRAKYEALAFAMPPPGPLSELAWLSILQRNSAANKRFTTSPGLKNIHNLTASTSPSSITSTSKSSSQKTLDGELPNRLIDYFCVVSCSMQLHPKDLETDLSTVASPEGLNFWPEVADCFPVQTMHRDMEFPGHLPSFVLPEGCHPSKTQKPPCFFTFVLTLGDGDRLYGGVLQIYDETMETEGLKEVILNSGYEGELPQFLLQEDEDDQSDIVFLPKCLVILSHHPLFDLFRESLLQLYRITLVEAPLPIERYISNLVSEIPLPPQGKIIVDFGFTTEKLIKIERPPINKLPVANFSYRPLFASLSVGNILVVMGCLMEECKVALLSKHFGILCPVAEALLSALFPFEWQGLYVPVMPYSMLDILDAPVPFIVGLDSKYLHETPAQQRPNNVVFVDLDRDVIHMGLDEITGKKRKIPSLPSRDAAKLKTSLDEAGGSVYLIPNNGIKGCIMSGSQKMVLVPNEERPKYAQMRNVALDADSLVRTEVLERTGNAFDGQDLSEAISGFRTVHGQMKDQDCADNSDSSGDSQGKKSRGRKPKFMWNKKMEILTQSDNARGQAHLLDMTEPGKFSSTDIRNAFLRFTVTVFLNYGKFLLDDAGHDLFDEDKFLRDLNPDPESFEFLHRVLKTQIFQRFLEERKENPDGPEIRFFDESILAKLNRSKMTTMAKGGKLSTPFLDDESGKVTKSFTPPSPSNQGLPDIDEPYHYNTFPALDYSLVGRIRRPIMWKQRPSQHSLRFKSTRNIKVRATQQEMVKKAMRPFMTAPGAIAAVARRSAKDLESALAAMSPKPVGRKGSQGESSNSSRRDSKELKAKKGAKSKKEAKDDKSVRSVTTTGSSESTSLDRMVNTLSRADTIMINARRKQAILLDLVVKLQAAGRMFTARKRYKTLRRIVIRIQRIFHHAPLAAAEEGNLRWQLIYIVTVQRNVRKFLAQSKHQEIKRAVCTLQRQCRGHLARRKFVLLRESAILVQKHIKGRRTRFVFELVRDLVSKVQARVRGIQVRSRLSQVFDRRMTLYRDQIFSLWHLGHIPLSLRTKIWPTFSDGTGFARLRLAESELYRLWRLVGIKVDGNTASFNDETTRLGDFIGIDNKTYCICKKSMVSVNYSQLPESSALAIQNALAIEEAERLQIYERLDSKSACRDVGSIYQEFDIPANEKMKKVSLAKLLWTKFSHAARSVSAMKLLFPELEGSLNIAFLNPSTKSRRRFPKAQTISTPPVEKSLWDEVSLEGAIKKHVQEVALIFITKVPSLMSKLDEAEQKKRAKWKSLRASKLCGSDNWTKRRRCMLADYLAGRYANTGTNAGFPNVECPPKDVLLNGDDGGTASKPIDTVHFPNIDMDQKPNYDPVKDANFPYVSFDKANGGNPIETVHFPDINTLAGNGHKPVESTKFPDLL